jgi:hypothetical protein
MERQQNVNGLLGRTLVLESIVMKTEYILMKTLLRTVRNHVGYAREAGEPFSSLAKK